MTQQNLPAPGAPDIKIARAVKMKSLLPFADEALGIPAWPNHYTLSCFLKSEAN